MINKDNNDLFDLHKALKAENLTINDYEESLYPDLKIKLFLVITKLQIFLIPAHLR